MINDTLPAHKGSVSTPVHSATLSGTGRAPAATPAPTDRFELTPDGRHQLEAARAYELKRAAAAARTLRRLSTTEPGYVVISFMEARRIALLIEELAGLEVTT